MNPIVASTTSSIVATVQESLYAVVNNNLEELIIVSVQLIAISVMTFLAWRLYR